MKKANPVRATALAICFLLLAAVGVISNIDGPVSASQSNPDCKNDGATRDRIKATLTGQRISDMEVTVKDGKAWVKGKVSSSSGVEYVKLAIRDSKDPCISEGSLNTDGLEVRCGGDQEILTNIKWLMGNLSCILSKRISVSVKNGVATISGSVPDERYKAYIAQLVESADCVKAGVKNNLVISARSRFSGDCSRLSSAQLRKMLVDEVNSRMPCGVADGAKIIVAKGAVTLSGSSSSGHRTRLLELIKSVCPGLTESKLVDSLLLVDPSCPPGAKSCTTIDGEQYCYTGCRICPTY